MKRFVIAEKEDQGIQIAKALGGQPAGKNLWKIPGDVFLSWCSGHLYELESQAKEYDPRFAHWNAEDLPLDIPELRFVPITGKKYLLESLRRHIKDAEEIIHAGDPDREGQCIVENVLRFAGYRGKVTRFWLPELVEKKIKAAWSGQKSANWLEDNASPRYRGMFEASVCRGEADWRFGINISRALSIRARQCGYSDPFIFGRVQTPTVALVVARDREIENFKPKAFFAPTLTVEHPLGCFEARYVVDKNMDGVDSEGYLIDKSIADSIIAKVRDRQGRITDFSVKQVVKKQPLAYSLTKLQKDLGAYGFTPEETLELAQSLYMKGVTTYPRTSCQYLPESLHDEAPDLLAALTGMGIKGAEKADPALKAPAWNTKEAVKEPHFAIIPTGEKASLTERERTAFGVIAHGYIRLFYPPQRLNHYDVHFEVEDTRWHAQGDEVTDPGWTALERAEPAVCRIPAGIAKGDTAFARKPVNKEGKTTPPSRIQENELPELMQNVARWEPDPAMKKILRDKLGIGTPATRASVIATVKRHGLLESKGKYIVSTSKGRLLVDVCPPELSSPAMTALWESMLDAVEQGTLEPPEFRKKMNEELVRFVDLALHARFPKAAHAHSCPSCADGVLVQRHRRTDGKPFWVCAGGCGYITDDADGVPFRKPVTRETCPEHHRALVFHRGPKGSFWACPEKDCNHVRPDKEGKPGQWKERILAREKCPLCGGSLALQRRRSDNHAFWGCTNRECSYLTDDDHGQPVIRQVVTESCPACGKTMVRRSRRSDGKPFWICSSDACGFMTDDDAGRPRVKPFTQKKCPIHKKNLRYVVGAKGPFWACPEKGCRHTRPDDGGKPGQRAKSPSGGGTITR